MAYIKNNWVDREGTTRYFETVDSDGAKIFTPDYTQVTELGTPVNADNMNHIEEGIAAGSFTKFDLNTTYGKNDLVTVIEDGSPVIYKSLVDNNIGNALSSSIAWEKISLGGGGGLEIGDIGIAPLGIDETKGKRRYLNGQLIIQEQYVQFTNKVKSAVALYPSLACTESEWQTTATMTVGGQVGKFVVDDEAGTIRLPKIIMPIQGLTDLSKLGEIVEAGLPNIIGRSTSGIGSTTNSDTLITWNGALGYEVYGSKSNGAGGSTYYQIAVNIDASKSSDVYGNSDTVQQEQIQYPYFIQVATGAETEDNIINEIELNNPFFFGMSQYFESEPNNISWLKSAGQYNSKAIYPAYYDWLLKIYNGVEVVDGVSVKLSTEEYTDYDFVLNTAEETFRLPLLDGSESLPSNEYENTTFVKNTKGTYTYTAIKNGFFNLCEVGQASGTSATRVILSRNGIKVDQHQDEGYAGSLHCFCKKGDEITVEVTVNTLSTIAFQNFIYAQGNGSLYFYVGETVQNANLINAGRIEEKLNNKLDTRYVKAYIIENYENGTSGYILYSNRYCEQWGQVSVSTTTNNVAVSFLKEFEDTNYNIQAHLVTNAAFSSSTGTVNVNGAYSTGAVLNRCSATGFYISRLDDDRQIHWRACGYIA